MNKKQEEILRIARSFVGPINYQYQIKDGEVPAKLNCARFTQLIYQNLEIKIGPATIDQAADAGKEIEIPQDAGQNSNLEIGDLIFFEGEKGHYNHARFCGRRFYIGHVTLYSGAGNIIHCFRDTGTIGEIKEEPLKIMTERRGPIVMIKRIL